MSCLFGPETIHRLVGDPVDVVTGAVVDQQLDLRLAGPLPLDWVRHYSSLVSAQDFSLGSGHAHQYDRSLHFDLDGIRYVAPLGRSVHFPRLDRDGDEGAAGGILLRRIGRATYRIFDPGEPLMEFVFADLPEVALLRRLTRRRATIELRYDAMGRLDGIVDSNGQYLDVQTDERGRVCRIVQVGSQSRLERILLSYDYDAEGNLASVVGPFANRSVLSYDAARRIARRTDPKGYTFHYTYDDQGRCIRSAGEDGLHGVRIEYHAPERTAVVARADGGEWTYVFAETGSITRIVDPYGGARTFVFDDRGRTAAEIDPGGSAVETLYGPTGKPVGRRDAFGRTALLPVNPNDPGRPAHRVASRAAEWEFGHLLDRHLGSPSGRSGDVLGRLSPDIARLVRMLRVQNEFPPTDAPPVPARWPEWRPEPERGRVYDEFQRLVRQRGPRDCERSWQYDLNGNVQAFLDFDGSRFSYQRESWNLLVRETDPLGNAVTRMWTTGERLASITDAGGSTSEYGYDHKNRLAEVRRHGAVKERYGYDRADNLVSKSDGQGQLLLNIVVGPKNLVERKELASGEVHLFEYDESGRWVAATTGDERTEFAYDEWGHRVREYRQGRGVDHEFSGWRELTRTTLLNRFTIRYRRTRDSITVTDPTGASQRLSILDSGLVLRTLPSGAEELTQFDALGRCVLKTVSRASGDRVWSRVFRYSGEGDLLTVRDSSRGTTGYEYDAAHRLVRSLGPSGTVQRFEYDAASNLLKQPGLTASFGTGNRLETANGDRFLHDPRNNISERLTSAGTVSYHYDSRDLLGRCEGNGLSWRASYDPLGRRTSKSHNGRTTTYYWDTDRLAAEISPGGQLRLYVYADTLALTPIGLVEYDSVDADPGDGRSYVVFANQIGAPVRVEDMAERVAWGAEIEPYGVTHVDAGTELEMPLRFPGHYHDPETGLHYNRFRYYSPELGRYIQSDPIGITGGLNLYAYPANPCAVVDVRGLTCPACEARAAAAREEGDDQENTLPGLCPHELADLDERFGPATPPWMIREGEGTYPPETQVVRPGEPITIVPYTRADGTPGRYLYIVDQDGNMHIAPENGSLTRADGSPRRTTHVDMAEGQPARVSGEINPTDDPTLWEMNDDSGRYSYRPAEPGEVADPRGLVPTRTDGNVKQAEQTLDSADRGGVTVVRK